MVGYKHQAKLRGACSSRATAARNLSARGGDEFFFFSFPSTLGRGLEA